MSGRTHVLCFCIFNRNRPLKDQQHRKLNHASYICGQQDVGDQARGHGLRRVTTKEQVSGDVYQGTKGLRKR
jgi:hypothetical protein